MLNLTYLHAAYNYYHSHRAMVLEDLARRRLVVSSLPDFGKAISNSYSGNQGQSAGARRKKEMDTMKARSESNFRRSNSWQDSQRMKYNAKGVEVRAPKLAYEAVLIPGTHITEYKWVVKE